jgi:hypothetical protein
MNVVIVIAVLLALIGIALVSAKFYKILKDFTGVFLAIAGTYLAYCFQKRQAFLTSLRELWHKCIEAKVDLIDYTYNINLINHQPIQARDTNADVITYRSASTQADITPLPIRRVLAKLTARSRSQSIWFAPSIAM